MKKWLSLILVVCMMLGTLAIVGCADTSDPQVTPTPTDSPDTTVTPTVTATPKITPDLPEVRYDTDGEATEFRFYHYETSGYQIWEDIWVDTLTGDVIGDAVFARNNYIEETYGVDITLQYEHYTDYEANVRRAVETGDDEYEVVVSMGHDIPRMYTANVFYNMNSLPYVDYDNPWWNQKANEGFTLAGYMPFTVSDITLLDKGATAACFFNKQLAADNNLGNFYDLVTNNQWTMEKLISLGETVAHDANGNDTWDDEDVYGLVSGDDPVVELFHGFGCRFISKDDDGYPVLSFASEENYEMIQEYLEDLIFREDLTFLTDYRDVKSKSEMFCNNQGLFMMFYIRAIVDLQNMECDYGILPIPKYDEDQEDYYCSSSVHGGSLLSVPLSSGHLDMVGVILEAMSAESTYTVIPAFYDVVLKDRSTRDAESTEMLDIIINNMVFDVGDYYCLASFTDDFLRITGNAHEAGNATPARSSDIASFWASREDKVQAALEKLIGVIDQWNELDY